MFHVAPKFPARKPARAPVAKVKHVNWTKLPDAKLLKHKDHVWARLLDSSGKMTVNLDELESLFSQAEIDPASKDRSVTATLPKAVTVLDAKKSMTINIVLKNFNCPMQQILDAINQLNYEFVTPSRSQGLRSLLPEPEDSKALKGYTGDRALLAEAETFLLRLMEIPNFRNKIETICLRLEFDLLHDDLLGHLQKVQTALTALRENKELPFVLDYVLQIGNFLNAGGVSGDAGGISLASLPKLLDTRSKDPQCTLLHYIARHLETDRADIVTSLTALSKQLDELPRLDIEFLCGEGKALAARVSGVRKAIHAAEYAAPFVPFVDAADVKCVQLVGRTGVIQQQLNAIAEYYIADPKDVVGELRAFVERTLKALAENRTRREEEARKAEAEKRKAARARPQRPSDSVVDDLLSMLRDDTAPARGPGAHTAPVGRDQPAPRRRRPSMLYSTTGDELLQSLSESMSNSARRTAPSPAARGPATNPLPARGAAASGGSPRSGRGAHAAAKASPSTSPRAGRAAAASSTAAPSLGPALPHAHPRPAEPPGPATKALNSMARSPSGPGVDPLHQQQPQQPQQQQQQQGKLPDPNSTTVPQRASINPATPSRTPGPASTPVASPVVMVTPATGTLLGPALTPTVSPANTTAATPFFTPPSSLNPQQQQQQQQQPKWSVTPERPVQQARPGWQPDGGALLEDDEEDQLEFKSVFPDQTIAAKRVASDLSLSQRASSVFMHDQSNMSRLPSDGLRAGKHLALTQEEDTVAGLEEEFV